MKLKQLEDAIVAAVTTRSYDLRGSQGTSIAVLLPRIPAGVVKQVKRMARRWSQSELEFTDRNNSTEDSDLDDDSDDEDYIPPTEDHAVSMEDDKSLSKDEANTLNDTSEPEEGDNHKDDEITGVGMNENLNG
eukprot:jgi/Psemu1/8713/gm1.8713_g